jgi:hypothetical protein
MEAWPSISETILGVYVAGESRRLAWRGDCSTRASGRGRGAYLPHNTVTLPYSSMNYQERAASIAFTVWSPMLGRKCE